MTLPELSIRRHVLAVMISAVLVLFGVIGYQELGTDRIPNIDFPVISVTVTQPGADPEIIDAAITSEVERAVNTVPGVDSIRSSSSPGVAVINIQFDMDRDIDVAFNEVQSRVNEIRRELPDDAEAPVIRKVETDASPILWLTVQGDRTRQQLGDYARNTIRPQIENISGVGEVRIGGGRERTIRIEARPRDLARYRLTVNDLLGSLESEHVQLPGGFVVGEGSERLLSLDLEYHDPEALEELIVGARDGVFIRLGDVADVVDGLADRRSLARFNGEPAVGLGVVKVSGTNTVAVIDAVNQALDSRIRPQLPPGMQISVASDQSTFILEMVESLYLTLALGVLFAALVLWLFLRNVGSTVIVTLAIPVALAAVIAVIFAFGYTLNSVTMLAMLLLIGVVVDDSIVVLENIVRHREEGTNDAFQGAMDGAAEVFFAVVATTLALAAIFLPVAFMSGVIGRFFESFAVVVTVGVLASSLVALTLTPMLCSRFLRLPDQPGPVHRALDAGFQALESAYRWLLARALRWRWLTLALAAAITAAVTLLLGQLGGEFVPEEDEGQFQVSLETPLGSSIDTTDDKLRAVEAILADEPGVASYFTTIGLGDEGRVNEGTAFVRLEPRDTRERDQQAISRRVQEELDTISGARAFAASVPLIPGQRGESLQFNITGPQLGEVQRLAETLEERLRGSAIVETLDLDLALDQPQLELRVDRERARDQGITTRDVALAANVLAGGTDVARYNDEPGDGQRYDVRIKAPGGTLQSPDDLDKLFLRNDDGAMVRLDSLADFETTLGPAVIGRYNLQYSAQFFASPAVSLSRAVEAVEAEADELLPRGYQLNLVGESEEFRDTQAAVAFVFLVAIILVYMVLASQFNAFGQPLVILAALPLAMVGGVLGLWLFSHTLNIYSMIGLVLLVGLVTKNGILLVDLTNQYRQRYGMGINDALLDACPVRLRPILMTSLTLILAMLPAALGLGAGSETQGPLAVAVISGMASSMVLTLVVIPAAYSLLENGIRRVTNL